MHVILLKSTAGVYLAGALLYLWFVLAMKERAARLGRMALVVGAAFHLLGFGLRYAAGGYFPLTNLFESLSFLSLCVVVVFLAAELRYNLRVLGSFVSPLAFLFAFGAAFQPGEVKFPVPALQSAWLPVHTTVLFVGYAAFAVAFAAGVMYLLQERQVKRKKLGGIFKRLPSLDVLDEINYRCLTIGFPLLTLGIVTGALWAQSAWGDYWSWDPKETASLATWLLYAGLLHGRLSVGWRGRRAAVLAIVGFLLVVFTFLGVNLLGAGKHAYTSLFLV